MTTVSTYYKVNEITKQDNESETNMRILKGISELLSKREASGRGCKKGFDIHERGEKIEVRKLQVGISY